jgi:hypothetical protein
VGERKIMNHFVVPSNHALVAVFATLLNTPFQ